jgi:hypothetical protein
MARSYLIATAVALPLVIAFAVLANTVELPRVLILALCVVVVCLPVLVGSHFDGRRSHAPPPRR